MGVKKCCRKDCTEIMCDFYLPDIGYLCVSCQDHFVKVCGELFINYEDFINNLKMFVSNCPKPDNDSNSVNAKEIFRGK